MVKRYGARTALDRVSLSVAPGEICGLLGPNGAGKTTLVSIVAGLRTADEGSVHVDGRDVAAGGPEARFAVGFAGQETGVYPTVSVHENLQLFGRLAGLRGRQLRDRIDEVADTVELTDLLDRPARHLSGGEKRRLHTAMALVHRPKVLLLDEPTTGVDVGTRSRLLASIRRLAAEDGCAVVYSTHYLPEVEALGATVAVIDHGRILARGTLEHLVGEHGSGAVELTFEGPAPEVAGADVDGSVLRATTDRPGPAVARLLSQVGPHAERLVSVELLDPSLESVFLAVTGRAYLPGADGEGHQPATAPVDGIDLRDPPAAGGAPDGGAVAGEAR